MSSFFGSEGAAAPCGRGNARPLSHPVRVFPEPAGNLDRVYLHEVTLKVIREEVCADTSDAQEVSEALSAA
jgi:hypothetical protein